jgi:hypothetical protein
MLTPRLAVYATPRIHVRPLPSGLTDYELWFRGEPDRKFYKSAANEFCARRALWLEDTRRSFESIECQPALGELS